MIILHWTPEAFENLVGKLVHRTKITRNFKDELSKIDRAKTLNRENGCKLLKILFEDSKKMKNLFGSPEELMCDLVVIQNFPNNSEFLGYPNQLNHLSVRIQMKDTEGIEFCSKIEAFEEFHKSQKLGSHEVLTLKSIGNRLAREMKDSFELIPVNLFDEYFKIEISSYIWKFETLRKLPDIVTDFEKFFKLCSELYDKKNDKDLLEELRQILEQKNNETPFSSNRDLFIGFYRSQVMVKYSLEYALGFNQTSSNWFRRKYPVVRVFQNDNERFMMSKELENALNVTMMNKFGREFPEGMLSMETSKDRELGIVRAVEWEELESILEIFGLSVYDIHIIDYDLAHTSRDIPVPINTPFGTYCTLAKHAFWNIFERIILEVGPVSEESYSIIFKWLARFDDVLSDSREYRYFVETWRTDKIMDNAYKEIDNKMPRNEKGTLEDMNIIKERFLHQNPKFIRFVINQGICVRPGRFYDLVKKMGDAKLSTTTDEGPTDFLIIYRKAFMTILPKIPDDKFVPKIYMEDQIVKEINRLCDLVSIDINSNLDLKQIVELEAEFLESIQQNEQLFVRRKKVAQKESISKSKSVIADTMSKALVVALSRGDFSDTECTIENIDKFMRNNIAVEFAKNFPAGLDEMTKKELQKYQDVFKK